MAYKNKEDQAKAAKKHYLANKEKIKERAHLFTKRTRVRNRNYVKNYLREHPCIDCGEDDIIVLEFDHVNGKKKNNISNMVNKAHSLDRIQKEIKKCEVRCANCHRRKHYIDRTIVIIYGD